MIMADHLNAHSRALHIAGQQDRPRSRLPPGSRSDVSLAAFQIKSLPSFGLTLSHWGTEDLADKKQCKCAPAKPQTGVI